MDYTHSYSRWDYATSDARSEPVPALRTPPQIVHQSLPTSRPPPTPTPPAPIELSKGVWLEDDDILHSADWPPVQEYLADVRKQKTLLSAPSDLVLALAALSVVQNTHDIAHWIFWAQSTYWTIGELVDSIALHQPRLIKTRVPWNGAREYKLIVNSRQQKFLCVVVQRKWYSTDCTGTETHKRNLRSTAEQPELTLNEYFGIVDNEGPSRRRAVRAVLKRPTQPSPPAKRTRRPAPAGPPKARGSSTPDPPIPASQAEEEDARAPSPPVHRASTRVRRKLTPSARSPRILSATAAAAGHSSAAEEPITAPAAPGPSGPTHARNRSSSAQSSASSADSGTVVARSPSVASVETAVTPASPRKRKLEDTEEEVEVEDDSEKALDAEAEGMVTRRRASRTRSGDSAERSEPPSRVGTPAAEPRVKAARARPRAKRARV